ncbi:hypothetical protein BJX76DRAFT_364242 [Aspergillus varians]
MARGILAKSRSPPQAKGISQPVLKHTDALPRNDLRDIERGVSYSRPMQQVVKTRPHPGMSDGRNARRIAEFPGPAFDLQVTNPPDNVSRASDATLGINEGMIGIALGSPRLLESQNTASKAQQAPPPTPPEDEKPSLALQRKSSKWRKIGGLFKAKSAAASSANHPFYQVRTMNEELSPSQGSIHSADYKPREKSKSRTKPIENTEVWPCLVSENEALAHQQDSSKPKVPGSLLQVEIPQVEMERYSVMFGGLLNNNRPTLLDRRSKTLESVAIPDEESPPPLDPPRRRATSPAPSQSSFSLFPARPSSKASKVLGSQNIPQAPDPLRRTQTPTLQSPPENPLSPNIINPNPTPKAKAQPSHAPQDSITSFLSSTSIGSDDEPIHIQKLEPIRTYVGMKEPDWEIINRKPNPNPNPNPPADPPAQRTMKLTINTRELSPISHASTSSSTTASHPASDTASNKSSPILSALSSSSARSAHPGLSSPSSGHAIGKEFTTTPTTPTPALFPRPPPRTPTSRSEGEKAPKIEVSVARSVSVSKGKKQVIVPVRARGGGQLNPSSERLVVRRVQTPRVSGPQVGHRPGISQDVRIEMA